MGVLRQSVSPSFLPEDAWCELPSPPARPSTSGFHLPFSLALPLPCTQDAWCGAVKGADAVAFSTCTYGPGAPPGPMAKFLAWVQRSGDMQEVLKAKPFAGECVQSLMRIFESDE